MEEDGLEAAPSTQRERGCVRGPQQHKLQRLRQRVGGVAPVRRQRQTWWPSPSPVDQQADAQPREQGGCEAAARYAMRDDAAGRAIAAGEPRATARCASTRRRSQPCRTHESAGVDEPSAMPCQPATRRARAAVAAGKARAARGGAGGAPRLASPSHPQTRRSARC